MVLQVMTNLMSVLNNSKFPSYCNSKIMPFLHDVPRFSVGSYSLEFSIANFVAPTLQVRVSFDQQNILVY
jgi:hypothetical protein